MAKSIENIEWYLSNPEMLLMKKPFTRGGKLDDPNYDIDVALNELRRVQLSNLELRTISQDLYYCEYFPEFHNILHNKSIPKIAVKIGDRTETIEELVLTLPLQKNIHSLHTLHLTRNPMDFVLCNLDDDNRDEYTKLFSEFKQEWGLRNMEYIKQKAVSRQKSTGDCAVLFEFDTSKNKGLARVISHKENKVIIPNYDEYGNQVAVTFYYTLKDGTEVLDTYDNLKFYRHFKNKNATDKNQWVLQKGFPELHGFTRIPVLYQRGYVAWEFAQSIIEMLELILNIYAVVIKRFGTFALWIKGIIGKENFQSDGSTLIINDPNVNDGGEAKVLEFPKPEGMIEYIKYLERRISLASNVTFILPEDIRVGADISGTAIMLTMKNDIAMAEQSIAEWSDFATGMTDLFLQMLSLEHNDLTKFTKLRIKSSFTTWMPESKTVTINNLVAQKGAGLISQHTGSNKAPDAAPDEELRLKAEAELTAKANKVIEEESSMKKNAE